MAPISASSAKTGAGLALVVPLFNEEEAAPDLIREIESFRKTRPIIEQIVLVDDGSTDRTEEVVRRLTGKLPGYELISLSRNFGHQIALTAGLSFVDADAAVILDADLQDPLHVIDRMVDKWRDGYDVVYGIRERREGETISKRMAAVLYYRLLRWLSDTELPLDTGDFRLLSRRVIDAYLQISEQQPFVRGLVSWLGFNQVGISYVREPRKAGQSKYTLAKLFHLAMSGITSFTDRPLRMAINVGLATALLAAFGGALWIVLAKYVYETAIAGWASLLFVIIFIGGVQLFFLGIVGLYLSRVYESVKGRPRYFVKNVWKSGTHRVHVDSG